MNKTAAVKNDVKKIKLSRGDRIFDVFNYILMILAALSILYPVYFIIVSSFSDPMAVQAGQTMLHPVNITFEGYKTIFETTRILRSYGNTIFYTFAGTSINLVITMMCSYALTVRNLPGKKLILLLIIFTMLFDGGMIPRFLIVRNIHIYDTIWAMLLPRAAWVFCILIARTFLEQTIPYELYECAQTEGCSFSRYFFSVVLPLSPALIAILILYYGTGHWNSYLDGMLYLQNNALYPLQLVLREILIAEQQMSSMGADSAEALQQILERAETLKYAVIVFATLPVLVVYPFLQKYFVKGVMIGAIKG